MKLIDADNFTNNLRLLLNRTTLGEISPHESISVGEIATLIKNEPTAYGVDKVVKQLEERIENFKSLSSDDEIVDVAIKEIQRDIEVVKSGGVEQK